MKHVCLRFSFESAPPFTGSSAQCAHAFIICVLPLPFACPVLKRRMNPPYFLFSGRFSLDIRTLFRYDICRKQTFFCFACLSIHRGAAGCAGFRMPAGRSLPGIASCGSGFESPPIVPAAPQSEQLRRKRHHCFSPVRARVILTAAFQPCLTPDTAFVPNWPKARLSAGSGHC